MEVLASLFLAVFRLLLPGWFESRKYSMEHSGGEDWAPSDEIKHRINRYWGVGALLFACALALGGCFTVSAPPSKESTYVTVYLRPGDQVRLREDIKAKVWVKRADGEIAPSETTLHSGWYVVPADERGFP